MQVILQLMTWKEWTYLAFCVMVVLLVILNLRWIPPRKKNV